VPSPFINVGSLNGLACYPQGSFFFDHKMGQLGGRDAVGNKVAALGRPLSPQPKPVEADI